jgi:hypothetical protein
MPLSVFSDHRRRRFQQLLERAADLSDLVVLAGNGDPAAVVPAAGTGAWPYTAAYRRARRGQTR